MQNVVLASTMLAVGILLGILISAPKLKDAERVFYQKTLELETEYAARYKTDLELIDECVADGLKRYRCVMELKR